jgi:DNA-binding FadR family transcriptional regulator
LFLAGEQGDESVCDRERGAIRCCSTDQTLTKLRQLIANGGLGSGGRIPPERTLANEMGVGRRSLRRALEILEQEGQITRHQGRGTFVQDKSTPVAAPTVLRLRMRPRVASAMSAIRSIAS